MPKQQINTLTKPPAADYLYPFLQRGGVKYPTGDRCSCQMPDAMQPSGCWIVEHDGDHYMFSPNTQMQKDIWLSDAGHLLKGGKEEALKMLRWYCLSCRTVQTP